MKLYLEIELDDYDEFTRRMLFLINQGKRFDIPLESLKGDLMVKYATMYHSYLKGIEMNVVAVKVNN